MNDAHWREWIQAHIPRGATVIDVGAAQGTFTAVLAEAVGPDGHVIAIEPHPAAAARLSHRDWPSRKSVHAVAVGAEAGQAELMIPDREDWWPQCSIVPGAVLHDIEARLPVPVTTLNCLTQNIEHVDFIKVDAQGSEPAIIAGASAWWGHPGTVWLIEMWAHGVACAGVDLSTWIAEIARLYDPLVLEWWPTQAVWPAVEASIRRQAIGAAINVGLIPRPAPAWVHTAVAA